jgi:formiminotetrahydrofolate cyclodeaminase
LPLRELARTAERIGQDFHYASQPHPSAGLVEELDSSRSWVRRGECMRDQSIGDFLTQLAERVPVPGGGAGAALHAAQGAALLGMVARYTQGPKYAEHEQVITRLIVSTDLLRARAVQLAEDDGAAFGAVAAAYSLPKDTDEAKAARSAAIAVALVGAAQPPAHVVEVSAQLVELAEEIAPIANRNVLSDVAAAAEAVRAAAAVAQVNIEVNLAGIHDEQARPALAVRLAQANEVATRAVKVTAAVRAEIIR